MPMLLLDTDAVEPPPKTNSYQSHTGGVILFVAPADLESMRWIIDRATNCLEPVHWPEWVRQVDRTVDRALGRELPTRQEPTHAPA